MRWYAMSAGFLTDPKVEALGEKHGPAGPLVVVSLMARAALEEKGGELETTYRSTAHETFTDREQVTAIIDSAIASGLCHEVSRDVTGVKLTFPAWQRHQATGRKAKERASKKAPPKPLQKANVTDSHEVSRDVPYKTRQDKTELLHTDARVRLVAERLDRVTFNRSLPVADVDALNRACERYSDRDFDVESEKFVDYYLDGQGENQPVRDVVATWRNWLKRSPSAASAKPRRSSGPRATVSSDLADLEREHAEALAEEAA